MKIYFYLCFTFGLFYFSEGKSCPEEYRPHKTRCDAYFKCILLKSKSHVWIPEKCDRGLIFEPNLKICVLPGDDWECQLLNDDNNNDININLNNDENNIYGINSLEIIETSTSLVTKNNMESLMKKIDNNNNNKNDNKESENNIINNKIKEFIEVKNKENNNDSNNINNNNDIDFIKNSDIDINYESSGDGFIIDETTTSLDIKENKESSILKLPLLLPIKKQQSNINNNNYFDPNLTKHLQRLSQLIDGLKQTYQQQNKNSPNTDLRPDQLNAFLAHYNIKSGFDAIQPSSSTDNNFQILHNEIENLENGNINLNIMNEIVNKQKNLTENIIYENNSNNKNNLNSDNNILKQKPETKVILKNSKRYHNPNGQYSSNSQIVVNRPEGSVLFSLPLNRPIDDYNQYSNSDEINNKHNNNDKHYKKHNNFYEYDSEPRITAETLKTVLELSKQMIENQNLRQIIPNNNNNNGYYQNPPIIQPMYYPIPIPSYNNNNNFNPHKNIYNTNNENSENQYDKLSNNNNNNNQKLPTTIIHNNVIPVHVTTNSEKGIITRPSDTQSSNDKITVDSYGNNISEYINYPPFLQPPIIQDISNQNSQKFYNEHSKPSSMTTEIPLISSPQKYNYPVTISNYYTPSPHLDNTNANSLFNIERYPTISTSSYEVQQPTIQYEQQLNEPDKIFYNSYKKHQQQNQNFQNQIPSTMMQMQNSNKYNNENSIEQQQQQSEEFEDNNNQNYHKNNIKQVVTNLLTPNSDQIYYGQHHQQQQQQQQQQTSQHSNQLVNIGGSFISYDIYKNQMLPALNNNNLGSGGINGQQIHSQSNIEILTCTIGIRQANLTDCTKYYICSKKDSKILTYSCPPFTGFNSQTRICDADTYAYCNPQAIISRYTITENRKIQMEALKALQDAKRIRDEAIQAQNLANLIRYETQKVINNTYSNSNIGFNQQGQQDIGLSYMNNQPGIYQQQQEQPLLYNNNNYQIQQMLTTTTTTTTTRKPPFVIAHKRRKYYCKEGDKIADQTSVLNYFFCYKTKDGIMKGHKMTCSVGLMFCSKLKLCTLPKNCNM